MAVSRLKLTVFCAQIRAAALAACAVKPSSRWVWQIDTERRNRHYSMNENRRFCFRHRIVAIANIIDYSQNPPHSSLPNVTPYRVGESRVVQEFLPVLDGPLTSHDRGTRADAISGLFLVGPKWATALLFYHILARTDYGVKKAGASAGPMIVQLD